MVSDVPLAQRCLIMVLLQPLFTEWKIKGQSGYSFAKKEGKVGIIYIKSVFPNSYAILERNTILATFFLGVLEMQCISLSFFKKS